MGKGRKYLFILFGIYIVVLIWLILIMLKLEQLTDKMLANIQYNTIMKGWISMGNEEYANMTIFLKVHFHVRPV